MHPGIHAQYHQQAFGPMQSLARSQGVATSAAAAAAAQVAAAAAAGVNPMQIMDHPRLFFQPSAAALGVGGMLGTVSGLENVSSQDVSKIKQDSQICSGTSGVMKKSLSEVYQSMYICKCMWFPTENFRLPCSAISRLT